MSNDNKPQPPKRDGIAIRKLWITKPGGFEMVGLEGHSIINAFHPEAGKPEDRNKVAVDIMFHPVLGGYVIAVDGTRGKHRYLVPKEQALGELDD